MPIANRCCSVRLPLEMSFLCGAQRERDGMTKEPSRTAPQLSAVVRAGAGGRTADFGVQKHSSKGGIVGCRLQVAASEKW